VHVRVSPKIRDYLHVTTIIMENIMIHEIWLKLEWDGMGRNGMEWFEICFPTILYCNLSDTT
jgi:hypothetical protein